jgi:hypothetical protein
MGSEMMSDELYINKETIHRILHENLRKGEDLRKVRPTQAHGLAEATETRIIIIIIELWIFIPFLGLGRFFSFLILYTDSRTPSTEDPPVIRPLSAQRTIQ